MKVGSIIGEERIKGQGRYKIIVVEQRPNNQNICISVPVKQMDTFRKDKIIVEQTIKKLVTKI